MKRVCCFLLVVLMGAFTLTSCLASDNYVIVNNDDNEIINILTRYEWLEIGRPLGYYMPDFVPASRGFKINMGALIEIPHTAYVHFNAYTHKVAWTICYVPAKNATVNRRTGLITCEGVNPSYSSTQQIDKTADGKEIYWEVNNYRLRLYTLNEADEKEIFLDVSAVPTGGNSVEILNEKTMEIFYLKKG